MLSCGRPANQPAERSSKPSRDHMTIDQSSYCQAVLSRYPPALSDSVSYWPFIEDSSFVGVPLSSSTTMMMR
jgi:hypothetical protein